MKTSTILLLGAGAVALLYLMNKPKPVTTVVYNPAANPVNSSAATTANEISAGVAAASSVISDVFGDSSQSDAMNDTYGNYSLSGVPNDGEN
jgi:hypothetical protein